MPLLTVPVLYLACTMTRTIAIHNIITPNTNRARFADVSRTSTVKSQLITEHAINYCQLTFTSGEAPPDLNSGRGVDGDCGLVVKCCSRFHEREEEGRAKTTQGSLTQVLIVRILGKLNCTVSHGVVRTQDTSLTVCKGHIENEWNRSLCCIQS